jgi:hypothetical protein
VALMHRLDVASRLNRVPASMSVFRHRWDAVRLVEPQPGPS